MNTPELLRRVDKLTPTNAMRVFDVAYDIYEQANLGQRTVTILAAPQNVKSSLLLPNNTPAALDQYEDGRHQACIFLQKIGIVTSYRTINPDAQRVKRTVEVEVFASEPLGEIVEKLREILSSLKNYKSISPDIVLRYDTDQGELRYGELAIRIAGGTLQHFICEFTFRSSDKKVNGLDIVDAWGGHEKRQSLYDACRLLNSKIERSFGLINTFVCREGKVWLNSSRQAT